VVIGASAKHMKLLVVFSHPSIESYGAAIYRNAVETLSSKGHEVRCHDLYREKFDPVLSTEEWEDYLTNRERNPAKHTEYIADLQWAEGLVVIYPTFYYGPPAMLKGWLERVWLPGVTFDIADGKQKLAKSKMRHIRLFVGITTSGSPWWWLRLIGDPGRSLWTKAMRPTFGWSCKFVWRQLHNMNHTTQSDRTGFLKRIEQTLGAIPV
jgi:NAD(P)H dehydrogenase (quinone)